MIFRRALQREFSRTAAAVFIALFAILISTVLIRLLGQAAGGRLPADAVLALIGFGSLAQLPTVLSLTLFIAILISLSRSYRDSEMVVWFAAGVPLTAWIRPVLMFALPLVVVIGASSLFLTPWAQQQSGEYRDRIDSRDDTQRIAPGVFRESSGARRVFFVEVGAGVDGRVRNVFVSEETRDGQLVVIASAVLVLGGRGGGWAHGQSEGDVAEDGEVPEERVVLEDEADAARADGRLADVLPVEADGTGAGVGHFQSGDDAQERGLAGAGGAEQRGEAAARDGEADIVERGVLAERFAEMGDFDTHEDSEVRRARHSTMLFRTRVSSARSASREATAKAATKLYSL